MNRTAAPRYTALIERLADQGEPLELTAQDIATVLQYDPTVLATAATTHALVESVIETLNGAPELTIEMAACLGAAVLGTLRTAARMRSRLDVGAELRRRRFAAGKLNSPRVLHS
jgi:hypothetical protein